jgi:hypothetical protein
MTKPRARRDSPKGSKGPKGDPRLARFLALYPSTTPPYDTETACREAGILWAEVQAATKDDPAFRESFGALEAAKVRIAEDRLMQLALAANDRGAMVEVLKAWNRDGAGQGDAATILQAATQSADVMWSERFPEVVVGEAASVH